MCDSVIKLFIVILYTRFIYVPSPHTSERLCNALVECLLDWNIDTKLSTITLDNCSTNDCMIEKIKGKLQLGTLIKEEVFLHTCCRAHILNLIVNDGLVLNKWPRYLKRGEGELSFKIFP